MVEAETAVGGFEVGLGEALDGGGGGEAFGFV
jgi:hypothetical protein